MPSFNVTETIHTSWTVSDVDAAVARFCGCFGFDVAARIDGPADVNETLTGVKDAPLKIAHLRVPGGHMVELIQYLGPDDRAALGARPCDTGAAHIALGVDDMEAAVATAGDYGIELMNGVMELYDPGLEGVKACYLRDPDGIMIELIQWNEKGNPFLTDAAPAGRQA